MSKENVALVAIAALAMLFQLVATDRLASLVAHGFGRLFAGPHRRAPLVAAIVVAFVATLALVVAMSHARGATHVERSC